MQQAKLVFLAVTVGLSCVLATTGVQLGKPGNAEVINPARIPPRSQINWIRRNTNTLSDQFANSDGCTAESSFLNTSQDDWGPNRPDEPFSKSFSLDRAVRFMDATTQNWQERKNCITCHTNGLYLIGQAMLKRPPAESEFVQKFAKSYLDRFVEKGDQPRGQSGAIEGLVTTAASLAISERLTGKALHPATQTGLDYVLAQQSPTGEWKNWLKCDWPPFEHDDHFGVSLMAVALGMADEPYRKTPVARLGQQRIEQYLTTNPPTNAHQKGMLLWGARFNDQLVTQEQRTQWKDELLQLQRDDGGWSLQSLGDESWKRAGNGKPQDTKSDAYGTGFAVFVLRQANVSADDPSLVRAIEWLKSNQRESGRWFVRSLKIRERPSKHYISHAGTTFAIMALVECGEQLEDSELENNSK